MPLIHSCMNHQTMQKTATNRVNLLHDRYYLFVTANIVNNFAVVIK